MIESLTGGLHTSTRQELRSLLELMSPRTYSLTTPPATLHALAAALEAHKYALDFGTSFAEPQTAAQATARADHHSGG